MDTKSIIAELDAIQNEFIAFDPRHPDFGGGFTDPSSSPDIRIARAVLWIERLKAKLREPGAIPPHAPQEGEWTITLSRYQRDNLLWLLMMCWGLDGNAVEPFGIAATGDWVGEIPWMLRRPGQDQPILDEQDHPNCSVAEMRERVAAWIRRKVNQAMVTTA